MHAYLITGLTKEVRRKKTKELFEERGVGEAYEVPPPKTKHYIKDIRSLNHWLALSSGKRPRGVILEDAHLLTTEAANSFLKTLEEPPGNTIIILTAPNEDLVLPTIASRCQIIELGSAKWEAREEEKIKAEETLQKLLNAGVGERLQFVEVLGIRREALGFCIGQLHAARTLLLNNINSTTPTESKGHTDTYGSIPPKELAVLIDRIDQTRHDLENNINVKLALGNLILNYPCIP